MGRQNDTANQFPFNQISTLDSYITAHALNGPPFRSTPIGSAINTVGLLDPR
jgi:hypothetical protein